MFLQENDHFKPQIDNIVTLWNVVKTDTNQISFVDACHVQQHITFAISRFASCHAYLLLNVFLAKRILKKLITERFEQERSKMKDVWCDMLHQWDPDQIKVSVSDAGTIVENRKRKDS